MNVLQRIALCSVMSLSFWTVAEAADEVTLVSTMNVPMSKYGMVWQSTQARVRVKNLAYEKSVKLVFKDANGDSIEAPATYFGPADPGYEIWEAWTNLNSGKPYSFDVSYEVAGRSYRSEGFELKLGPILYAGQNVQQVLGSKQFYGSYASFTVAVQNIGWQKNVAVHYSCDGFRSEDIVPLSFQPQFSYGYGYVSSPTADGFEIWSGSLGNLSESCSVLNYYFTYDVNGQRYADTNFGVNYVMSR
jgi:hypothetical protein